MCESNLKPIERRRSNESKHMKLRASKRMELVVSRIINHSTTIFDINEFLSWTQSTQSGNEESKSKDKIHSTQQKQE